MKSLVLLCLTIVGARGGAVWIDTDPSVQRGGHEVDDGFALVQAFHSPELQIRGVSVVFGNAPLATAFPIGQQIVRRYGPEKMPVYSGAASAQELGKESDASLALAAALRIERLTILVLGPATNVATMLKNHPELARKIDRIIAVAGRRPGQHFLTGRATQPFRDLNFELDPQAFQVILDSRVPLVLAPWEISAKVWLTQPDLDGLLRSNPALDWLVGPASDWLAFWKQSFGVDGFNPFDTLAVAYALTPDLLHCESLPAKIETLRNDIATSDSPARKPFFLASKEIKGGAVVQYCSGVQAKLKTDLLARLALDPHKK